jgi:SAM-dependent methyltransferase
LDLLNKVGVGSTARLLDAGCGTGKNLLNLSNSISRHTYGIDFSRHAIPYWKQRGITRVCRASINSLPFPDEVFDAATSIDVLESDAVEEGKAYGELWRVVRNNGFIVVVVPAYNWLMTREHHQAVHASRRYTKQRLAALLGTHSVELVRVTYLFALLFPAIALYRLGLRALPMRNMSEPRSELRPMLPLLNDMLCRIMMLERRLVSTIDLPFGSSLVAVVRKRIEQ